MKHFYTILASLLFTCFAGAQTFEFSVVYVGTNGSTNNHQLALVATPSSTVTNGVTADMGGGFYVPIGLTIGNFVTGDSAIPNTEWTSQALGSNGNGDAYFISRTEGGGSSVILNGDGPFQLVLFDVIADPNPTTGNITFVENGDPVFNSLFVQNYININLGSGTVDAYSNNNSSANSVDFSTLSTKDVNVLNSISVSPNPTKGMLYLSGDISKVQQIDIYSITGQHVMEVKSNFKEINITELSPALYFVKLNTAEATGTIKIIKD